MPAYSEHPSEGNPGQRHQGGELTHSGESHGKGRGGRILYKYGNWHPQVAQEVSLLQENVPVRATNKMPNPQAVLVQVADRVLFRALHSAQHSLSLYKLHIKSNYILLTGALS